ncbi:hypothetical protein TL16_g00512 [Triparma laevis f. inornata]|uniref:GxGYxYP putative glycoside hydrolase C-terminal domain-containing protein n=2 Tax=Triparma laevis TaxID=1534972 RepID=A0A9W7DVC9_9STRA|nr:hypothetical protein TL16_g00512 [Triparma laevis f. inornata]GMH56373.1 hypothetical protein TrLO_g10334 [Triparma laevis f. longispina]
MNLAGIIGLLSLTLTLVSVSSTVWLANLDGRSKQNFLQFQGSSPVKQDSPDDLLNICFSSGVAKGYIKYDYKSQQTILPNIITLAAMLDAIPIDLSDSTALNVDGKTMLFDTTVGDWKNFEAIEATEYMYRNYVNETMSMYKMNPGYATNSFMPDLHPELTGEPNVMAVDFIVKEKLFCFFMTENCVPHTKEHALMEEMVNSNPWPTPIPVYGYDDSIQFFGGQAYEAETNCVAEHNLGQIASSGTANLAWHGNRKPLEEKLQQPDNLHDGLVYDPEKTYVTFVVGDGDNLNVMIGRNLPWVLARQKKCGGMKRGTCYPLVWTLSARALDLLPDLSRYFYDFAANTGSDYFMLPPSGDLYSYPSTMNEESKISYIETMEDDWERMGGSTSVHWEWFYSWLSSVDNYFSRFGGKGARGFFLTTVPYMFPMPLFFKHGEDFKVVGEEENVVLFRSNEWRGTQGQKHQNKWTPEQLAEDLKEKKGWVTHLYLTSDGNNAPDAFDQLFELLGDEIVVVNDETLVGLALQKDRLEKDRQ